MKIIQCKTWTAVACLFVSGVIGFLFGGEFTHVQSLSVEQYELPSLLIDQSIYDRALKEERAKAESDPLVIAHLHSTLNLIEHDIAKARLAQ